MGYETIYLAGASGGRLDHTYVNLQLMIRSPHHVVLIDDRNLAETFRKGSYEIAKGSYTYASFFALEDSVVSLKGMVSELHTEGKPQAMTELPVSAEEYAGTQ